MKKIILLCFSTVLCTVAISQQIVRGPYLQVLTPNSIQICWRTDVSTDSRVDFGTSLGAQTLTTTDAAPKIDHFVTLTGLSPATTYFYSVGNASQILDGNKPSFRFKTAPVNGTIGPYRIWAIGDFGKGNQGQIDVMNSFLQYQDTAHTDLMLMLGDNAYSDGTQVEFQEKLFDIYDSILPYIPVFSTPGNHDYNSVNRLDPPLQHAGPYFDIFNNPMNGEAGGVASTHELYYSFDYGNIHFISLNSEIQAWTTSGSSQMFQWLEQDLQANTKEWVVCYFHQPPYSRGSHNSDDIWELLMLAMRQNALPKLEQYGVDVVICGHSHVYERSKLIKGHYGYSFTFSNSTHAISTANGNYSQGQHYTKYLNGTNAGTVYVVCGNSGSKDSNPSLNHPVMVASDGGDDAYGSMMFEVNGNRLDGKYIKSNGVIHDHFTIIKPDGSTPVFASVDKLDEIQGVKLFPNPTDSEFQISFTLKKEQKLTLIIHDVLGKEVLRDQISGVSGKNTVSKNIAQLASGQYVVSLFGNDKPVSLSFTKK